MLRSVPIGITSPGTAHQIFEKPQLSQNPKYRRHFSVKFN